MILRTTLYVGPQNLNRISEMTQSLVLWNCGIHIKSICPPQALLTCRLASKGPPTLGVHEAVQRENMACDTGACRAGNVNSAFPPFSPGQGGEHRYYNLFCLMWCLIDVLATYIQTSLFFDSCLPAA